ncbi:hypothetical protein [Nocardia alni]|uniref:hypothetical protein n=1 Tax=Nocardia alni TaxID=2815723 RepID=UPI001C249446|nr:hypothetical protein [Nocardia alni]
MVDPVTLGVAAAALLASKFGEGFAKDAGSSSWRAIGRLREVIAVKLGHRVEDPAALGTSAENPTPESQAAVAELVTSAARSDPDFAREVELLVVTARRDRAIEAFVANAYDNAKQVNIRGDNTGTINL